MTGPRGIARTNDRPEGGCGYLDAVEVEALLEGRLDPDRRSRFAAHVEEGCGACALLAADAEGFATATSATGAWTEEERVGAERDRAAIERWLARDRRVPASVPSGAARLNRWPAFQTALLAAGIVTAILAYPAYLGLVRLPLTEKAGAELRAGQEAADREAAEERTRLVAEYERRLDDASKSALAGPVDLTYLSVTRAGVATQLEIGGGRKYAFLALALDRFPPIEGGDLYTFEAVSRGEVRWSVSLKGADLERYRGSEQGAVVLPVPESALPAGRQGVRVVRRRAAKVETLIEVPIDVVR